jgi:putative spermidine/putrescine transport system substrate-binding protein
MTSLRRRRWWQAGVYRPLLAALIGLSVLLAACGTGTGQGAANAAPSGEPTRSQGSEATSGSKVARPADWQQVTEAAEGQTVRWWMFGGDERINRYVDEVVTPAAAELGVTIERVPVDDTAAAVQRVIAEQRAGEDQGGVDLIWLNGENFAKGKEAGLWLEEWARALPNARFVDYDDPTITTDFGVPIDGQESPWSRAFLTLAYDRARIPDPPDGYQELLAYAEENPGRVTYPAPPAFTGSAFVRQAVQALGEEQAFELLANLKPVQWRDGETFPEGEAELNRLFGNGQVDFAMSYDPNFVATAVRKGQFPDSARPFVLDSGTLQNTSYVTIPSNAANRAGALVVANLLLRPELQAKKADPDRLGIPTVLDVDSLPAQKAELFDERSNSPYTLDDFGTRLEELPADRVGPLEERWQQQVLR